MSVDFQKALYTSVDRRENLFDLTDDKAEEIKALAKSVCCMVKENFLKFHDLEKEYTIDDSVPNLAKRIRQIYQHPPMGLNDFNQEPCLGFGTAFLVTDRAVLTAAHCVCQSQGKLLPSEEIQKMRLVFDFQMKDKTQCKRVFSEFQVFKIESVLDFRYQKTNEIWRDWAILQLDKKVKDRLPLKLRFSKIKNDQKMGMLGHPRGLPIKWSGGAIVRRNSSKDKFETDLDAFKGNSGSPVFCTDSLEVVGILCEGNKDYRHVEINFGGSQLFFTSLHIVSVSEKEQRYETCQRVSVLTSVEDYLTCRLSRIKSPSSLLHSGLYLLSHCMNTNCSSFKKSEWNLKGLGEGFDYAEQNACTTCSSCSQNTMDSLLIGLRDCKFKISGLLIDPQKNREVEKSGITVDKTLTVINPDDHFKWAYIKISCWRK